LKNKRDSVAKAIEKHKTINFEREELFYQMSKYPIKIINVYNWHRNSQRDYSN
jgi:hypothetical protein